MKRRQPEVIDVDAIDVDTTDHRPSDDITPAPAKKRQFLQALQSHLPSTPSPATLPSNLPDVSVLDAETFAVRLRMISRLLIGPEGEVLQGHPTDRPLKPSVTSLSADKTSFLVHAAAAVKPLSKEVFEKFWNQHPPELGSVVIMGVKRQTQRFTQSFGRNYRYSGQIATSLPVEGNPIVSSMLDLGSKLCGVNFNQCLVNWYEPTHHIGAHSDAEKELVPNHPILSISWGETRRFRLTSRDSKDPKFVKSAEIALADGDIVVMGGRCQRTHKHAVPPVGKRDVAAVGRRINFTLRCFSI